MDMNALAKQVTLAEGKKVGLSIAQVKEVLGIVADMMFKNAWIVEALLESGRHRAQFKAEAK